MAGATAAASASRLAAAAPRVASRLFPLPSVSFSGAGFLGCYHVGVASCLIEHGHLLRPGEVPPHPSPASEAGGNADANVNVDGGGYLPPILTGVSAGSIVSAGLSAGVSPEDSMDIVLQIARRTREAGGSLDVLWPGFSLVDQVPDLMLGAMRRALGGTGEDLTDYDLEMFRRRTMGGRGLRIGLMDRQRFSLANYHSVLAAYCYVDEYRDVEDAVAASILSSFIPGMTGTARGASCPHNDAVRWAWGKVREMRSLGFVKDGRSGKPVENDVPRAAKDSDSGKRRDSDASPESEDLCYWDGGLVNLCPTIDDLTVMVTPLHGSYSPNPSISPLSPDSTNIREKELSNDQSSSFEDGKSFMALIRKYFSDRPAISVQVHERIQMEVDSKNLETLYRMMHSSDDDVLQERFQSGYDDARRFLAENNMLRVYSV